MKESEKDVGWMYHIMPVKTKSAPKLYPPLSKIAGMGIHNDECYGEEIKVLTKFKSTDTPYQILSKMGGRQDLLYHRENDIIKKPPVPYPRCEWFYLDDLETDYKKIIDCNVAKKYEYRVPDYMASYASKQKEFDCSPEVITFAETKKKRKKLKKLPEYRPGYSKYTRPPVKLTFAQKQYPGDPRITFPKHDISKVLEKSKHVMENYYVRDYNQYRKQWLEIKNTETIRNTNSNKARFRQMTKDCKWRLAAVNNRRSQGFLFA